MSYASYIDAITTMLKKYGYTQMEIDSLLGRSDIKKYLQAEYKHYTNEDKNSPLSGGHSPNAVANCLDMLY